MSNYFPINAVELSQEELNMIEGGTFCFLGGLLNNVNYCAPKVSYCAPKVDCCTPKVSYCSPAPAVKPAAATPVKTAQP